MLFILNISHFIFVKSLLLQWQFIFVVQRYNRFLKCLDFHKHLKKLKIWNNKNDFPICRK
ncbi:hypothetical protein LCGC14_1962390 [marine sediment metagenome]|uniref:Uncharacterized protein n=1 Tax=marine sediment metagenome TaxID=412755 RepID=A0A0F9FE43_9ZZZZ